MIYRSVRKQWSTYVGAFREDDNQPRARFAYLSKSLASSRCKSRKERPHEPLRVSALDMDLCLLKDSVHCFSKAGQPRTFKQD